MFCQTRKVGKYHSLAQSSKVCMNMIQRSRLERFFFTWKRQVLSQKYDFRNFILFSMTSHSCKCWLNISHLNCFHHILPNCDGNSSCWQVESQHSKWEMILLIVCNLFVLFLKIMWVYWWGNVSTTWKRRSWN